MIKPVNRHILVDYFPKEEKTSSGILLPDDYKVPEEKHTIVNVIAVADDVAFKCKAGDRIIIDLKMLEKITLLETNYYLILENYVIGVIE